MDTDISDELPHFVAEVRGIAKTLRFNSGVRFYDNLVRHYWLQTSRRNSSTESPAWSMIDMSVRRLRSEPWTGTVTRSSGFFGVLQVVMGTFIGNSRGVSASYAGVRRQTQHGHFRIPRPKHFDRTIGGCVIHDDNLVNFMVLPPERIQLPGQQVGGISRYSYAGNRVGILHTSPPQLYQVTEMNSDRRLRDGSPWLADPAR